MATTDRHTFLNRANRCLIRYGPPFEDFEAVRAEGVYLYDREGRRCLDFTSGQMSAILGHSHPDIVAAVREQSGIMDHLYSCMLSEPVISLAESLIDLTPKGLDRVMLLSTGGESNEAALRMARMYTGGYEVVAFSQSWHGVTGAASAATYAVGRQSNSPPTVGAMAIHPPTAGSQDFSFSGQKGWRAELDYAFSLIDKQSNGALAAFIAEPILSAGGIIDLPQGYLRELKRHCEARGMLLIVDEAQTGMGRCGAMFAFERDEMVPDILTLSKTLGAGLPLSAVLVSEEVEQRCHELGFLFVTTHVSDPLPAAVGLKVLEVIARDQLVDQADRLGRRLGEGLKALGEKHDCVGGARGRGLLRGLEIVSPPGREVDSADLGYRITQRCMQLGLSMNIANLPSMASVFRIAPPLIITDEELDRGLAILDEAIGLENRAP